MNNFIEWAEIELKRDSGHVKTICPKCSPERKNKKDPSLYVNIDLGIGKCFHCEGLTFRDKNNKSNINDSYSELNQEWYNHTTLSEKTVTYLKNERGIPQRVIIELGFTEERQYQPKLQKEVANLVFNFFENDKLVNKKYRGPQKTFTQSKNSKPILYNINALIGEKECYIVEGEIDVASFYTVGVKNVVSVPNGANDNDEYWKNSQAYLAGIERFIIAVDNDEKGKVLKDKIAQRLGRYKCDFIEWKGKDANDDLLSGDLENSIRNKKRFPVAGTFTSLDLMDGIFDLYHNGLPDTIYPKSKLFGDLKDVFSVMRGHLVTATGIPSHGKSAWVDWYVINLINDYGMKASWFSPEHSPMNLYKTSMIEKVTGKNFWGDKEGAKRVTSADIYSYIEWSQEKVYLTGVENDKAPTWDWLLEKFKEQMYSFGIDIFVVDAFNKVMLPGGNKIDKINEVLSKLTHFAQANNVIVFLVAHPTKMKKDEYGVYNAPTLYDVAGSADFRNQTHDGFTIYRHFENHEAGIEDGVDFINNKTKFSFQGEIGATFSFKYCKGNGRFYKEGVNPFYNMLTEQAKTDKEIMAFDDCEPDNFIEPNKAFDNENDCPF